MKFEDAYFTRFDFTEKQIINNWENALRDLRIAKKDAIREVKFNYAYSAFIKAGMALLSFHKIKVKSVPGHHIKIIEKMSQILSDNSINDIGNAMRTKRNLDFYAGGVEVSEKECTEYLEFVNDTLDKIQKILSFT